MKPVLAALSTAFLAIALFSGGAASADPPGEPPGLDAPPCHGRNDEPCREDPQPDHGVDCLHSDDHVCAAVPPTDGEPHEDDVEGEKPPSVAPDAPPAIESGIQPPRTGDGGLADPSGNDWQSLLSLGAVAGAAGVLGAMALRQKGT
jgi:hypothetical protein